MDAAEQQVGEPDESSPNRTMVDPSELQAMQDSGEKIEMIEEFVDSGLKQLLQTYEPVRKLNYAPVDGIPEAYTIELDRPLPYLDSGFAKAYEASDLVNDARQIYALVCEIHTPVRTEAMKKMVGVTHPNMITLYEFAVIRISTLNENRLVLFLSRPEGTPLSELMVKTRFREQQIIKSILEPIYHVLEVLQENKLSHGRINPSNIFVGTNITVGELYSEPPGYSQHHIYEPIERAVSDPIAKGEPTMKTDIFSLAIMSYDLLYGLARYKALEKREYLSRCMMLGVYHVLCGNINPSETYADFFRGGMMESKSERWGFTELEAWMDGKRFNLIAPAVQQATRSFVLNEVEYFNLRSLAHGIAHNWRAAGLEIGTAKIDRWVDMLVGDSDVTDLVTRLVRVGGHDGASEEQKNEMLVKLITILDPGSPIRIKHLSLNVDGMGAMVANYAHHGQAQDLKLLMEVIGADVPTFWSERYKHNKTDQTASTIWLLQKLRSLFKLTSMGFGVERVKYDLNPSLPCQSPLLRKYCCPDIENALLTLDALAENVGLEATFVDRDLAAFFGSRINLNKEIKFKQLEDLPNLRENEELKVMRILSLSQEKIKKHRLVGLCTWIGLRVESMLENIHNRKLRKRVKQDLKKAVNTGQISYVLALLIETNITRQDNYGYRKAAALFHYNNERLAALSSDLMLEDLASNMGGRLAVTLSYLILMITLYTTLDSSLRGY
ncbi:MAG: hypothetical protein MRY32_01850 [Rickettsiales bacterium]|nr:hypothetical protein [Rickettsiales bacterium]